MLRYDPAVRLAEMRQRRAQMDLGDPGWGTGPGANGMSVAGRGYGLGVTPSPAPAYSMPGIGRYPGDDLSGKGNPYPTVAGQGGPMVTGPGAKVNPNPVNEYVRSLLEKLGPDRAASMFKYLAGLRASGAYQAQQDNITTGPGGTPALSPRPRPRPSPTPGGPGWVTG